jgi:hypothetical protein
MQANPEQTRQLLGCGWLPAPVEKLRPFVRAPEPLQYKPARDENGERLCNVCPGYTTSLPAVIEIARARFHWDKGHLREAVDGRPTDAMMLGIEILSGAIGEVTHALATPRDKGGLAGD